MRDSFDDPQFDRLWRKLVDFCPQLEDLSLPEQWEQEFTALIDGVKTADRRMVAIRILAGLGVISRRIFELQPDEQTAVFEHFAQHFSKNVQLSGLPSVVFEMQVYCRLAMAEMRPKFIPRKRKRKTPDIWVPPYNMLIECKNLSPQDFIKASVQKMCQDIRKHSRKARDQFLESDTDKSAKHLVIMHLPPDLKGFFSGKPMGERIRVLLAATLSDDDGYEGTPGEINALFVETSLSKLYDRHTPVGQPTEYWHVPLPPTHLEATHLRFLWKLFISMQVCPFEGYASPIRLLDLYLRGQSAGDLALMDAEIAMQYWRRWNDDTGGRFSEFELPPLPAFPQT